MVHPVQGLTSVLIVEGLGSRGLGLNPGNDKIITLMAPCKALIKPACFSHVARHLCKLWPESPDVSRSRFHKA